MIKASILATLLFAAPLTYAATSNWIGGPGSGFNTGGNWDNGIPNDVAAFTTPSPGTTKIGADEYADVVIGPAQTATVNQLLFDSGAGAYFIDLLDNSSLTLNGLGITNNFSYRQTINIRSALTFNNNASAGDTLITNYGPSGPITFNNNSTADHANIQNHHSSIIFNDNATAGNSTLTGAIDFKGHSTAGHAWVDGNPGRGYLSFYDNSSADHMVFTTESTYHIRFLDSSTAGNATLTAQFTDIAFRGTSTAGDATIYMTTFPGGGSSQSPLTFYDSASAGNAMLSIGEDNTLDFRDTSTGANASVVLNSGSRLKIEHLASAGTTLKSLSGSGTVELGSKNLTLTGSDSASYSGNISGEGGSLTQAGAGTLTLAGINTYTGGTTVSGGTLKGNTQSLQGDILNNTTLNFDQASTHGTYSGVLSGSGNFIKSGEKDLTLTATNPFSGLATIQAGKLILNGSLGDTVVENLGSLSGTGSLGTLTNNGSVAPGANASGDLHVDNYAGAGAVNIEFDQTAHTSLQVAHDADITEGTLNVHGNAAVGQYTMLSAGNLTGPFKTVNPPPAAFLIFSTHYTATDAVFTVTQVPYVTQINSGNQGGLTTLLDLITSQATGPLAADLNALSNLPPSAVSNAFNQISGDALTSFHANGLADAAHFTRTMSDHMDAEASPYNLAQGQPVIQLASAGDISDMKGLYPSVSKKDAAKGLWGRWVSLFDHTDADEGIGSPSSHSTTGGFQTGYDFSLTEELVLGVSMGYSKTDLTVNDRGGSGHSKAIQGGIYSHYMPDPWFLNGSIGYTDLSNDNSRSIVFPGVAEVANASFKSRIYTFFGEAGYQFKPRDRFTIAPSFSLRESYLRQNGYTETGAPGLNLIVADDASQSLVSGLGVRIGREFHPGRTHTLSTGIRTAWEHELATTDSSVSVQFAQAPGPSFVARGTPRPRDTGVIGLDANFQVNKEVQLFADYSYSASSKRYSHAIMGGAAWHF